MKKILIIAGILALLLLIGKCGWSQTWYGSNPTFTDGFVGAVNYTGTATIKGNVTFTNGSVSTLETFDVTQGATLNLQQSEIVNGYIIEANGTVNAAGDFNTDDNSSIAGTLLVAGTYTINNDLTNLSGCSFIKAKVVSLLNGPVLAGSGLIYATSSYNYRGPNQGPTTSSTVYFNIPNSGNIGSGSKSTAITGFCNTIAPVTITQFSVQESKLDQVTASWTAEMETNVGYYVLQGSTDGVNFVGVDTVQSYWPNGTSASPHVYTESFDNALQVTTEAGMGAVAFVLVLGIVIGMIKKGPFVARCAALFVFSYALHSCTKQNTVSENTTSKYKQFRLVEVDLDGTVHYDQQICAVK